MHYIRRGTGQPLLLLHGIGGSWRSWSTVFDQLAEHRDVLAVDLPGFGATPPLPGEVSIRTLADAVTSFLRAHDLLGIDAVGSSMGARLVLELARRGGVVGAAVALNPGGFWQGWEIPVFYYSVAASVRLVRGLQPLMPALTGNAVTRTLLFSQLSAHPARLSPDVLLPEMRTFATAPSFDELLRNLAYGERQQGAPAGSIPAPLVIGWGRQDLVCLPRQAPRAQRLFPDAQLYWFDDCGHFPQWDQPTETVQLILRAVSGQPVPQPALPARAAAAPRFFRVAIAGVFLAAAGAAWLATRAR
ncbi:alpha/beta fold hydrolase [Hymenobacter glacieicola]|uniref:Hydrolase n=1 Tax=Hymenobacter glacieicola TaxID=1562124 RepID=A0ABQ1WRG0_9BACT|nr:alpha/beta fold hydrolase [Hymenobacter glacieicola]GGG38860.1 hydrolase [Hymenobacter glacieicola]